MTYRLAPTVVLAAAAAAVACGSKIDTAISHNNAGSGSSTLKVTGSINAAQSNGSFGTALKISVRDGAGAKVSGATVTVHNQDWGTLTLAESSTGSGDYVGVRTTFPAGDFGLAVSRGSDTVQGVVVGGPAAFSINGPKQGATVPANQPLGLSWTTPITAKAATIATNDYNSAGPDTGSFTIPATGNPANATQLLTIGRYNEVDIAGALSGSILRVTVEASVPYVVQ